MIRLSSLFRILHRFYSALLSRHLHLLSFLPAMTAMTVVHALFVYPCMCAAPCCLCVCGLLCPWRSPVLGRRSVAPRRPPVTLAGRGLCAVSSDDSRRCALLNVHRTCRYRMKLPGRPDWMDISQICRNRVCENDTAMIMLVMPDVEQWTEQHWWYMFTGWVRKLGYLYSLFQFATMTLIHPTMLRDTAPIDVNVIRARWLNLS